MVADPSLPSIVVLSSLFPNERQPMAGLFVRERMFRVGSKLPLAVVAPQPWFPLQTLLRRWRPGFRAGAPGHERQRERDVWFPHFFSLPGIGKRFDGLAMALAALPRMMRLKREQRLDLIDAHFGYPDGDAATRLGRWLGVPVTITLRGSESRIARDPVLAPLLRRALLRADHVFAVSESLRRVAIELGIAADKLQVVGNGVDLQRFRPLARDAARRALGLVDGEGPVLVGVGGLVERKGFHRVIEQLPALLQRFPRLVYVIIGGASPEGDMSDELRRLAASLELGNAVRFLGPLPPDALCGPLSAADLFVLATRNEGWANVFLEAMACGLPVVTTDVGGNAEVVCSPALGQVVPFGDGPALCQAIAAALEQTWDRDAIRAYAMANSWDRRVATLLSRFAALHAAAATRRGMRAPASVER